MQRSAKTIMILIQRAADRDGWKRRGSGNGITCGSGITSGSGNNNGSARNNNNAIDGYGVGRSGGSAAASAPAAVGVESNENSKV